MKVNEAIKNRILFLCEERHLNMRQIALNVGMSYSTVKNIIYGKSLNPGAGTLEVICRGIGVTMRQFYNDDIFDHLEPYDGT